MDKVRSGFLNDKPFGKVEGLGVVGAIWRYGFTSASDRHSWKMGKWWERWERSQ